MITPEVMRTLDDWDTRCQHRDVADVNMHKLLASAQPHDLRLARVQPQSAGSHPLVDVVDAGGKTVDSCLHVTNQHANVDLTVISVLVDMQTVARDQLVELSGVQNVQQRPQDGTLRNAELRWLDS